MAKSRTAWQIVWAWIQVRSIPALHSLYQMPNKGGGKSSTSAGGRFTLVHSGDSEPFVHLVGILRGHHERLQDIIFFRLEPWFAQNPVGHLDRLIDAQRIDEGGGQNPVHHLPDAPRRPAQAIHADENHLFRSEE